MRLNRLLPGLIGRGFRSESLLLGGTGLVLGSDAEATLYVTVAPALGVPLSSACQF